MTKPSGECEMKENDAALQKETLRRHRYGLKVIGQQIVSLFLLTANPYGSLISLWSRNESCCNYSSLAYFVFLGFCPFSKPYPPPPPPCSHIFSKKPMCLSLLHRSIMLSCYSLIFGSGGGGGGVQKAGEDKDITADSQKHPKSSVRIFSLALFHTGGRGSHLHFKMKRTQKNLYTFPHLNKE